MLIIPAIDLRGGQCVRLTQGRRAEVKVYDADPVEVARGFAEAGAQMLHVVDLDGAFREQASPNREVARRIIEAVKVPVQFGGGLRTEGDIRELIECGAERVIVGTLAAEEPEKLEGFLSLFGARVVVGIDARDGRVLTRGWEEQGSVSATELARRMALMGVSRIIYTDVARDGMLSGVNVEQTRSVAEAAGIPVTASGGVASLADLEKLKPASASGVDSVIVGKALYEGRFTLREALEVAAK
ncbi:MAG TPA: 1-(5-phosphoribosyl)-5-[(5-phosphoribosylamino)methylideneamino]imidazole-4-carboxamide isomerase [Pyrinomonadaceae bacterium]|nr:1-(5-phosphoribosyl)-5-[(5-phosphoribosylamino)methylideneamino]imidazole-4-carboxamide isomerase [Pyrinomonadaceae bacterium]